MPFPGLYDPAAAGDLSPLLNSFEAAALVPSECPMTNVFEADFSAEPRAAGLSAELAAICGETDDPQRVRAALGSCPGRCSTPPSLPPGPRR